VLEVGCGTGVLAAELAERVAARVWAVDVEPAMVEVARRRLPAAARVKVAAAEQLPFRDGWFERVVLRLAVHLLDRGRALPELARVTAPDGRTVIATFDPSHFDDFWLNRLFPSFESIDRARFPGPGTLADELRAAGFADVESIRLSQHRQVARADALERIRGRHISTFDLVDDVELAEGTARAERELPETIDVRLEWAIVVAFRSARDRR
jgi:ubiquinone/menaquinone biosynthesis C-methylase UbiE